ncbi:MAG TPA: hypothetical protein VK968_06770 [Roseimicrobium sp.]|nr:hypothetical protein [Roseimicrobium sp.]
MLFLQRIIHYLEEGGGMRWLRGFVALMAFVAIAILYPRTAGGPQLSPEGMDSAQVARNVASGQGFTTHYIRPLSVFLTDRQKGNTNQPVIFPYPDLAHAPLHPWLLGGWMKLEEVSLLPSAKPMPPDPAKRDLTVMRFHQLLYLILLVLVFRLAARLFDLPVAWLSVLLLGGSGLMWDFASAGLPTLLSMILFVVTIHLLAATELGVRENQWGGGKVFLAIAAMGLLVGATGLTQYACLALLVPVAGFAAAGLERRRIWAGVGVVALCVIAIGGWLGRNHSLSGTWFGTAGFAAYSDSLRFPADTLERNFQPVDPDSPADLNKYELAEHRYKLARNLPVILQRGSLGIEGGWIAGFFAVSLFLPYRNPTLRKLRWFLIGTWGVLLLVQALGQTAHSRPDPVRTSENLLILLLPMAAIFAAGLFVSILDQLFEAPTPARIAVAALFVFLAAAPTILRSAGWGGGTLGTAAFRMQPTQAMTVGMWVTHLESAVCTEPEALAWYGGCHSMPLPLNPGTDLQIGRQQVQSRLAVLTPAYLQTSLPTVSIGSIEGSWERLSTDIIVKQEIPDGFPWRHAYTDWFPTYVILAESARWSTVR